MVRRTARSLHVYCWCNNWPEQWRWTIEKGLLEEDRFVEVERRVENIKWRVLQSWMSRDYHPWLSPRFVSVVCFTGSRVSLLWPCGLSWKGWKNHCCQFTNYWKCSEPFLADAPQMRRISLSIHQFRQHCTLDCIVQTAEIFCCWLKMESTSFYLPNFTHFTKHSCCATSICTCFLADNLWTLTIQIGLPKNNYTLLLK